jgi:hypothetical protein
MAEEFLRAEAEYWRDMELLSGQRDHFKPGLTDETGYVPEEVSAEVQQDGLHGAGSGIDAEK